MSEYKMNIVSIDEDGNKTESPLSVVDQNLNNVKNIVYQREHPNPYTAYGIVISTVIVMFILYILFLKKNISGGWMGNINFEQLNERLSIIQNPFTGHLTIYNNSGTEVATGWIDGAAIQINVGYKKYNGMIDRNIINWCHSSMVWKKIKSIK